MTGLAPADASREILTRWLESTEAVKIIRAVHDCRTSRENTRWVAPVAFLKAPGTNFHTGRESYASVLVLCLYPDGTALVRRTGDQADGTPWPTVTCVRGRLHTSVPVV